jgi:TolA-binding protein
MKRSLALAFCCLLVFAPAIAFAKKKTTTPAVASPTSSNGNGLGAGGVPALRDRLEAEIAALQAQINALAHQVNALTGQLQSLSGQLQTLAGQVADQGAAIADLESLDTDDDGDGFSEHAVADCNDASSAVHPGATDPAGGTDDNCDGTL